jgi:hypothetical protein
MEKLKYLQAFREWKRSQEIENSDVNLVLIGFRNFIHHSKYSA